MNEMEGLKIVKPVFEIRKMYKQNLAFTFRDIGLFL